MVRVAALTMLLASGSAAFGQESAPDQQKLEIGVWRVPPGFVASVNPANPSDTPPLPGFRSKQTPNLARYDATEFLKSFGLTFPPGSEAIFDPTTGSLVVRNTTENLELVDTLTGGCPSAIPSNISVEISTLECSLPAEYSSAASPWPEYFKLIRSSTDRKLLDRVSAVTKSGVRTSINHVLSPVTAKASPSPNGKKEAESAGSFQEGESGTVAEAETVIGPDGMTIDANVNYRFRQLAADNTPSEISFKTSFSTWEGYPVVLSVSPVRNQEGKFVVVVANIRLVGYGRWIFENPQINAPGQKSSVP